jgi:hypothetical protein
MEHLTIQDIMRRCAEGSLEDGDFRNPVCGLFRHCDRIKPIEEALRPVASFLDDSLATYIKKAKRKANQVVEAKYPHLSENAMAYIVLYTMQMHPPEASLYCLLNKALRDFDRGAVQPWIDYIWGLLQALKLLPPCNQAILYRGFKVKGDLAAFDKYKKGHEVVWHGFSSTSPDLETQTVFTGKTGSRVMFHVHLRTPLRGRNIRDFSLFPKENEILLPPLMQFKVKSRASLAEGLHMIHLEEVDPDEVIAL